MINRATITYICVCSLLLAIISAACASSNLPASPTAPLPSSLPASPTALVTPSPSASPTASMPPSPAASEILDKANTFLSRTAEKGFFSGVVLIGRDGSIIFDQGYGMANREEGVPNTPQIRFRIASMTKQFTAMAILLLQAKGKLNVQDQICQYIPNCPDTWSAVTIHHLLTHTSGITSVHEVPEDIIADPQAAQLVSSPGKEFRYSNLGYNLAGLIVEKVSGQPLEDFLQDNIFDPLNMAATGFDCSDNEMALGYVNGASQSETVYEDMPDAAAGAGLCSTVEDLYRWDQALYPEELIGQSLLNEMFNPHIAVPDSPGWGYGYGWALGNEGMHKVYQHPGGIAGFASIIARYPDDRVVIIVLSNQENTPSDTIKQQIAKIMFGD